VIAMATFEWGDEQVNQLRELFKDRSLSAESIGDKMGCSGKTILRKVKLLGLNFKIRNSGKLKSKFELDPIIQADTGWYIPIYQRKQLLDLKDHHCRYPYNEVGSPDFFFCGADVKEGKLYCECHCRQVYKPYEKLPFKNPSSKGNFSFKRS